jgi:hypothetical protein
MSRIEDWNTHNILVVKHFWKSEDWEVRRYVDIKTRAVVRRNYGIN